MAKVRLTGETHACDSIHRGQNMKEGVAWDPTAWQNEIQAACRHGFYSCGR
jgi:hypothetical protein